jgi:hypothetical protein
MSKYDYDPVALSNLDRNCLSLLIEAISLQVEAMGMSAENSKRLSDGDAIAYGEESFKSVAVAIESLSRRANPYINEY